MEQHYTIEQAEAYALAQFKATRNQPEITARYSHMEEHLLWCHRCLDRVEKSEKLIRNIRVAARRVQREESTPRTLTAGQLF